MKQKFLSLVMICLLGISTAFAQSVGIAPFGYGASATGGGSATPTLVSTLTQLKNALGSKPTNKVIIITQNITLDGVIQVKDGKNLTILGLPGVKLYNPNWQASKADPDKITGIFEFTRIDNLIVRNLIFEGAGSYDCDGRDHITLDCVTNAWIDHCDFQDAVDDCLDIKKLSDNITISWCKFHYEKAYHPNGPGDASGDKDHRFVSLLGSSGTDKPSDGTYNITYAYLWFGNNCMQRMVRCRNAELHFLGCYWNSTNASYYIGPENVKAYVELCTFEGGPKTSNIFKEGYGGTNAFKAINSYAAKGLPADKGSVPTPSYTSGLTKYSSASDAKTAVTNATCGAGATLKVSTNGQVASGCDGGSIVNTYTVTFNANGHGTAPAAKTGVTEGSKISAPTAPTANGYTFGGWYKEAACTNAWNFSTATVTSNITLYAKWTEVPAQGGGEQGGGEVSGDACFSFTVSDETATTTDVNVTGGKIYLGADKIETEKNTGFLGYKLDGDYSATSSKYVLIKPNSAFAVGDVIKVTGFTTTANGGYSFYNDRSNEVTSAFATQTYSATKTKETHSYTIKNGDPIVGATQLYIFRNTGTSSHICKVEIVCSSSTPVITCTDPTLAYETTSMTKTLGDAAFTNTLTNSNNVAITYSTSDEDIATVDNSGKVTMYSAGTVTITASAAEQTVNTKLYCAKAVSYTLTIEEPVVIPTYTILFNANGGSGTMTDANQYEEGTDVTIPANAFTAPSGKIFDKWNTKADGTGISYSAGDALIIQTNMLLYAIWKAKPETVTGDGVIEIFYCGSADATANAHQSTNFTGINPGTKDVTGTLDINGSVFNATKGVQLAAESAITVTVPANCTATLYILAASSGSSPRNITLSQGETVIGSVESSNSSKLAKQSSIENLVAGTYTLVNEGGVNYCALALDIVPVGGGSSEPATAYAIIFRNADGSVLQNTQVNAGATPSYTGATPTKAQDDQYSYTFAGWNPAIVAASAAATYTATYNKTARTYTIALTTNGGTINAGNVTSYTFGTGAALPSNVTKSDYTFGGWYDNEGFSGSAVTAVSSTETGNKTYFAKWNEIQVAPDPSDPVVEPDPVVPSDGSNEGGWFEACWMEFNLTNGAAAYVGYVSADGGSSWTKLDKELIRNYGTYGRVDAVGLQAGNYKLKVVPVTSSNIAIPAGIVQSGTLVVKAHDRGGFAHTGVYATTGVGAYKNDGTLKDGAKVLYVSAATAKTITTDVQTDAKGTKTTCVGIQTIIDAYQKGFDTTPIAFRFLGHIQLADLDHISSTGEGIQVKGRNADSELNLTFEGIGKDAMLQGFGFLIRNAKSVEFRNFGIATGIDDDISLDTDNDHIWVHHIDAFYGPHGSGDHAKGDGAIDVKTNSKHVTVSYNRFWDTGKSTMCGMTSESGPNYITYHHNWFDHSDSRHARIRTMSVHMYNNYYDGIAKYGVGATCGSSVFMENNYFRNCPKPMLISKQGTDIHMGVGTSEQIKGTFSGETGGIIKSYGNAYSGSYTLVTYQQNATHFDCWEAPNRNAQVPAEVVTLLGGTRYDNFDTNSSVMYTYTPDAAANVPGVVTGAYGAGRLQHGNFKFTFTDADDSSSDVNSALRTAVDSYTGPSFSEAGSNVDPIYPSSNAAPELLTQVPAAGATGVALNGNIVLSFDQPVACTANATLNGKVLTPVVDGTTVSFAYSNLTNETLYTFSLAANSVANAAATSKKYASAISISFTTVSATAVTYTVSYDNQGHGSKPADVTNVTVLPGTLPTLSESGWTFGGWYTEAGCLNKATAGAAINANTTLYAKWTQNQAEEQPSASTSGYEWSAQVHGLAGNSFYTISGSLSTSKGTASYGGVDYSTCLKMESGTSIAFTLTEEVEFTMVFGSTETASIKVDGTAKTAVSGNVLNFTLAAGNHTFTKNTPINLFYMNAVATGGSAPEPEPTKYTLTWDVDGVMTSSSVAAGAAIVAPANPSKAGYTFAGWSPAVAATMPAKDVTYTATWTCNISGMIYSADNKTGVAGNLDAFHTKRATYPNAVMIVSSELASSIAADEENIILDYAVGTHGGHYYECQKFVLVDPEIWYGAGHRESLALADFYSPVDFVAVTGSYTRNIPVAAGGAGRTSTCCLPFELNSTIVPNISKSNLLTFAYYEPIYNGAEKTTGAYAYFQKYDMIPAGVSCFIYTEEAFALNATFDNTWITAEPLNSASLKGTFEYKVIPGSDNYGMATTGTTLATATGKASVAFRSVLSLEWSDSFNGGSNHSGSASAPERLEIRIIGEDGLVTDLNGVSIENAASEAEHNLPTYSIDGKMVGEVSAPGLYIENGKLVYKH